MHKRTNISRKTCNVNRTKYVKVLTHGRKKKLILIFNILKMTYECLNVKSKVLRQSMWVAT